jgi:DNA-binding response OmpR family regulator
VTDLMMPEKEGVEVIMELRQKEPHIAILAVSGVAGNDLYLHVARELGADAVLRKPFEFDALIEAVSELLNQVRQTHETDSCTGNHHRHGKSANEVQSKILAVMHDLDPRPLTNTEMASRLEGFAPAEQVAINMRAMAVDGRLKLVGEGAETKCYRLPQDEFAA